MFSVVTISGILIRRTCQCFKIFVWSLLSSAAFLKSQRSLKLCDAQNSTSCNVFFTKELLQLIWVKNMDQKASDGLSFQNT